VKKWTREDEAACKIQKHVRRFLAKRQLARKKEEHADYEELMDKLEKEVSLLLAIILLIFLIYLPCGPKKPTPWFILMMTSVNMDRIKQFFHH